MSESLYEAEPVPAQAAASALGTVPLVVADARSDPLEVLHEQIGQVVVAHPGVLRLEPTLLGALRGFGERSSLDGIQLVLHGRVIDLDVNVATRSDHQARASVLELHHQLTTLVTAHGYVPGSLEISVLAVEEPAVEEPTG